MLCNQTSKLKFSSCKTEIIYPLNNSHLPLLIALENTILLSMSFTILNTSYKWNHIPLDFCDWLISLSIMSSRFTSAVVCVRISFLMLNKFQLHLYATFYLFLPLLIDIWVDSAFQLLWI